MAVDPAWTGVIGTLGGAIVGGGVTAWLDRARWTREEAERRQDRADRQRERLYADRLKAYQALSTRSLAFERSLSTNPLSVSKDDLPALIADLSGVASACQDALGDLEPLASEPGYEAAHLMVNRIRATAVLVRIDANQMDPAVQKTRMGQLRAARTKYRSAMRADLQGG